MSRHIFVNALMFGVSLSFVGGKGCSFDRDISLGDNDAESPSDGSSNICSLPPVSGPCDAYMPSYYYNATTGSCESFVYGGCRGNENRFATVEACQARCGGEPVPLDAGVPSADICHLPAAAGTCLAYIPSYYYNATTGSCESFVYGGCEGNENRFATVEACQARCGGEPVPLDAGAPSTDICQLPLAAGPCDAYIPSYYYNATTGACESFVYGGCKGNENRFATAEACQARCGGEPVPLDAGAPSTDICRLPLAAGPCDAYIPSYYYNATTGSCVPFVYGGCAGNENRFETAEACQSRCGGGAPAQLDAGVASTDICQLPAVTGSCEAYMPRYYFDAATGQCESFVYGGCEGNENRFETVEACQARCTGAPTRSDAGQ